LKYYVLRLYKYMGSRDELVEDELRKLGELIRSRVSRNRSAKYITMSVLGRNRADGMLIIGVNEGEEAEIQLISDYIKSNFKHITVGEVKEFGRGDSRSILEMLVNF